MIVQYPVDFTPQDWILIVDALAQWAEPPADLNSDRDERAYELIEAIAREQGLPPGDLVRQGI